jgi:hypothetical protein
MNQLLRTKISELYRPAIRGNGLVHGLCILLNSFCLDGGFLLRLTVLAAAAHWTLFLLIIMRRPTSPTPLDLRILHWGFIPLVLAIAAAGGFYNRAFLRS